jgi:hypothetical protein
VQALNGGGGSRVMVGILLLESSGVAGQGLHVRTSTTDARNINVLLLVYANGNGGDVLCDRRCCCSLSWLA